MSGLGIYLAALAICCAFLLARCLVLENKVSHLSSASTWDEVDAFLYYDGLPADYRDIVRQSFDYIMCRRLFVKARAKR